MKGFHVLGVTQVNDSYPNVKYKLAALKKLLGDNYSECVASLNGAGPSQQSFSSLSSSRPVLFWRLLVGHIKVFLYILKNRADSAYVCYPGIFISAGLSLPFIRRRYSQVYLDAFISIYDTTVVDRQLLRERSLLARVLYRLEKRAFASATIVLVDTPENAEYYSTLFDLPIHRFRSLPLSIPNLSPAEVSVDEKPRERLRCLFVGTFVPLQGIRTIVETIELLAEYPAIDFVFVGDGQDAKILQDYLDRGPAPNVTWHRGHFPTTFVNEQISKADICLGIFDDGRKAQRVLPYKIYYYLALGMPIVTAATATTNRVVQECLTLRLAAPLILVPPGDAQSLATTLTQLRDNPSRISSAASAGATYYRRVLSDEAIEPALRSLIENAHD